MKSNKVWDYESYDDVERISWDQIPKSKKDLKEEVEDIRSSKKKTNFKLKKINDKSLSRRTKKVSGKFEFLGWR